MQTTNLTCFLIDDDIDDQEIFTLALQDVNTTIKCIASTNCYEALEKLSTGEVVPDFIFLDLNMPLANGKQCLEEIKRNPKLNQIPVIICSTSSRDSDIKETLLLGASNFLIKPSSIHQLTAILKELFSNDNLPFLLNEQHKR